MTVPIVARPLPSDCSPPSRSSLTCPPAAHASIDTQQHTGRPRHACPSSCGPSFCLSSRENVRRYIRIVCDAESMSMLYPSLYASEPEARWYVTIYHYTFYAVHNRLRYVIPDLHSFLSFYHPFFMVCPRAMVECCVPVLHFFPYPPPDSPVRHSSCLEDHTSSRPQPPSSSDRGARKSRLWLANRS
jgi:hypothetical protein